MISGFSLYNDLPSHRCNLDLVFFVLPKTSLFFFVSNAAPMSFFSAVYNYTLKPWHLTVAHKHNLPLRFPENPFRNLSVDGMLCSFQLRHAASEKLEDAPSL